MGNGSKSKAFASRREFLELVEHVGRMGRRLTQFEQRLMGVQSQVATVDEKVRKILLKIQGETK